MEKVHAVMGGFHLAGAKPVAADVLFVEMPNKDEGDKAISGSGEMRFGIWYRWEICHNVVRFGGSRKMKFFITISQDEDGMYIAECPSIPGCISQGATAREAEKNIQQAIKECLEVRAAKGMPLTVAVRQVEVHL